VAGENHIIKSLMIFTPPNIVRISNQKRLYGRGHASRLGDKRNVYRIFIGKTEGKRQFGYSRYRSEDNIKMCLKQSGRAITEFAWLRIQLPKRFSKV